MLIDTGDVDSRDSLVQQLKARNVKELDAIIITHLTATTWAAWQPVQGL